MLVLREDIDPIDERKVGAIDGRHDTRADGLACARNLVRVDMFFCFTKVQKLVVEGRKMVVNIY
jgi:hypothetical protein